MIHDRVEFTWGNSVQNFLSSVKEATSDMEKGVERAVIETGKYVKIEVNRFTPVKTGRLRRSWLLIRKGRGYNTKMDIANRTPYASFVEYGTSRMYPRRMMTNAVSRGKMQLRQRLNALRNKIAREF